MSNLDRRSSQRKYLDLVDLSFRKENDQKTVISEAIQIDISEGGVALLTETEVNVGEKVSLDISLGNFKLENIPAVIRYTRKVAGVYRANMMFDIDGINEYLKDELFEFINEISLVF